MKTLRLFISAVFILSLAGCEEKGSHPCGANETDRVGDVCMDGTRS